MGVPQFFHWLVKNYGDDILIKKKFIHQQTDYLFLDFNCAIHPATKKEGLNASTYQDLYQAVGDYLDTLFKEVQPRKLLYVAIDGVAPLAKIRQQRFRRFKSVSDKLEKDVIERKFKKVETKTIFDFNMISPATEFMNGLTIFLQKHLISKYGNLEDLEIILNDASYEGEGEHKIMDYIRDNNLGDERVIIYGLDSDLIFLSLLNCHKITDHGDGYDNSKIKQNTKTLTKHKTFLLREEIFFGTIKQTTENVNSHSHSHSHDKNFKDPKIKKNEPSFIYFDVNKFREIVIFFMQSQLNVKINKLIPLTDFESKRIILDYTALSFILGNDFLPHLPSLKIKEGGLERSIECYNTIKQSLGLNHFLVCLDQNRNGIGFDFNFLFAFLSEIAKYEMDDLADHRLKSLKRQSTFRKTMHFRTNDPYEKALLEWDYIEDQVEDTLQMGTEGCWKRYYEHYLGICDENEMKILREKMCHDYLEGMVWTLHYYVSGCQNWLWLYSWRCAPSVADLILFLHENPTDWNTLTKPNLSNDSSIDSTVAVSPEEQLLMIMPPQSANLLPPKIAKLMTSLDSPILQYYPTSFKLDHMGHRFRWESYPILPTIDRNLIKLAVQNV